MIFSNSIQRAVVLIIWLLNLINVKTQVCSSTDDPPAEAMLSRDKELKNAVDALLQWVADSGGYVSPKLELRAFLIEFEGLDSDDDDDDDPSSSSSSEDDETYTFGVFVKDDQIVKADEELIRFPDRIMIYSDMTTANDLYNTCLLSDEILNERILHRQGKSEYGPYIDFLEKYVIGDIHLPGTWSENGRYLLGNITQVPYFSNFQHYYNCYMQAASEEEVLRILNESGIEGFGDPDVWDEHIEIALSRARFDDSLVPLFDIITHSNDPNKINVVGKKLMNQIDKSFTLFAARDIGPSEELRHSFGLGKPQENHWLGYVDYGMGTLEMFRAHGFVESYPQRWFFADHELDFAIHAIETEKDDEPALRAEWLSDKMPDDDAIYTLKVNHDGLVDIRNHMIEAWNSPYKNNILAGLTPHEISMAFELLLNYIAALRTALQTAEVTNQKRGSEHLVTEETVTIHNIDHLYFQMYQCSTMITKVERNEFIKIDDFRSAYQQINYYKDPQTDDRCLYLDNVYQQCIVSSKPSNR